MRVLGCPMVLSSEQYERPYSMYNNNSANVDIDDITDRYIDI